ncbi:MAG: hypothetical protein WCS99_07190 [Limisphaerales bacterium]
MEIKINNQTSPVGQAISRAVKTPVGASTGETASFEGRAKLDAALASTPEVRPEVVARARELVSKPSYPPREILDRIANLLAIELSRS